MSVEASVDALTAQTTQLLDACAALKSEAAGLIAAAVVVSQNASQIPLVNMARNLIDTQALYVNHVAH